MTLKHLKVFITVCECGSMTKAAKKLFIAQPSVSLTISEIEKYYNIKLFDRISKKLYLTKPGEKILEHSLYMIDLFDKMEDEIKSYDKKSSLKVGASITIGNFLLPYFIKKFQNQHKEVKVNIFIDNSKNIENLVLENQIDFGLVERKITNKSIKAEIFMSDELIIICSPEHSLCNRKNITIKDIMKEKFILREKGSASREKLETTLKAHNIEIKPIWESISTQSIIKAVEQNLGISILPYFLVKEYIESNKINKLLIEKLNLKRNYYIIYHKNKFLTPTIFNFLNQIREFSLLF